MSLRIAVIDSGVHAAHPHIGGVAGGVAILPNGEEASDFTDHLGHGTAVSAVIRQKAPDAEIWAIKIFHASLATNIVPLVRAIEWSVEHGMEMINLSLGTDNPAHREFLEIPVSRAIAGRCRIVAAGPPWLPGAIDGVIPVELDWDCPRDEYRARQDETGRVVLRASGYPRPIPGVPLERNLKGLSFAVANVTGLLARLPR